MCLNRIQPAKNWALVIGATASVHAVLVVDGEGEGVGRPSVGFVRGLYVVVTINENVELLRVVSVASEKARWEVKVLATRLLSELAELNGTTKRLDLVR